MKPDLFFQIRFISVTPKVSNPPSPPAASLIESHASMPLCWLLLYSTGYDTSHEPTSF